VELRDIEVFLTLAEELHFGRTAERLHVTPARVSQAIKKQERAIGAALFERTSRVVRLTPAGERLRDDLEPGYRRLWAGLRATSELAGGMFYGYPRFAVPAAEQGVIGPGTATVGGKPAVQGPDDWFALVTRLRVVMEDPTQLLSGAVTDYASAELVARGNDPTAVIVPGLDGEPYPQRAGLGGETCPQREAR